MWFITSAILIVVAKRMFPKLKTVYLWIVCFGIYTLMSYINTHDSSLLREYHVMRRPNGITPSANYTNHANYITEVPQVLQAKQVVEENGTTHRTNLTRDEKATKIGKTSYDAGPLNSRSSDAVLNVGVVQHSHKYAAILKKDISVPDDFRIYVYNLSAYNRAAEGCYASPITAPCFRVNYDDGFGPIVTPPQNISVKESEGMRIRRTDQFALFVMFHKWLLQSRYITDKAEQADVFYLPVFFTLGGDSGPCYHRHYLKHRGPYTKLMSQCSEFIDKKKHFVTTGWPEEYPLVPGRRENVVNIVLEIDDVKHHEKRPLASMFVAPYPSDGHFTSPGGGEYVNSLFKHKRDVFILFAGKTRKHSLKTPPHAMRNSVIAQLKTRTDHSYHKFKEERGGEIPVDSIPLHYAPHDCRKPPYDEQTTEWMRHSVFCLQPPGDSNSRKSFFDALISGCIPVLFQLSYVNHVTYPFEEYIDYSKFTVTVPLNKSVKQTLRKYRKNAAVISELQENLRQIMQYLQYNDPSAYDVGDDAFTLLVKEMYDRSAADKFP